MEEYRDKLQKKAEKNEISPIKYWHTLVITYQLMNSEEKEKEYKNIRREK